MSIPFLFVSLICTAYLLSLPVTLGDAELDVQSLLAFKKKITHDPHHVLRNWHANSSNACSWTAVTCSSKHPGRVVELQFYSSNLQGTIAPEIGNLSFLKYLTLSSNNFTGGIPPSIGSLHRLQFLNVSGNSNLGGVIPSEMGSLQKLNTFYAAKTGLTGIIPPSLGNCSLLQKLRLDGNKLSGSIPDTFGSLAHLSYLFIGLNSLVGRIPPSLFNCSNLQFLNLFSNRLSGSIPHNIGSLPRLNILVLARNSLTATIPDSIGNISTLTYIEVIENQLHGPIPPSLGSLSKLEGLYLWNNSFTGTMPISLCNATSLSQLALANNRLHGTVPLCIGRLPNLEIVDIGHNNFVSGIKNPHSPIPILNAFSNSSKVSVLFMGGNKFTGTLPFMLPSSLTQFAIENNLVTGKIPMSIGNLSRLIVASLDTNGLEGTIPATIGLMKSLQEFSIRDNLLEGNIPREMTLLNQSLAYLYLSSNKLSGSIPSFLGELTSLGRLDLSMNSFSGPIPKQLGNCLNLEHLDLSSNYLSNNIPPEVANLKNIQITFNMSHNMLSGAIRGMEIPMAQNIDLSHNHLSGEIAMYMVQWLNAKFINLSFNSFSGVLPESIGAKLTALQSVDLSRNNFTGVIPQSMHNLSSLGFLNVSYNSFEGNIPCSGAFQKLSNLSFLNNPLLCGKCFNMTECIGQTEQQQSSSSSKKIIIISVTIVGALFVTVLLYFLLTKKRKQSVRASPMMADQFVTISEREVVRATANFSPNNLLGQGNHGSVYTGVLPQGDPVAIKIFSQAQHKSGFMKECQTLGKIRHRNIMKIITVCCAENLKAIIMPLMPKGNLQNLLHEKDSHGHLAPLSLRARMKLLYELAAGLSYLHHHCTPPIVHCDIKPENVLLDYDFTVKLSDFGIAKLLGNYDITETSTLKGSIGYIAPEFGAGKVSIKGDIYSFGVVLLEVMTRVKPTDDMFTDNLNLCNWVAMVFQGDASRVQLESILNMNSGLRITEEEEWVIVEKILKIGIACSSHLVEERPAMDKVEGMLVKLCDVKSAERVGPGNLDAILASSLISVPQVQEFEDSSTF